MLKKGDVVTIDGSTGEVIMGEVPMVRATDDEDFQMVRRSHNAKCPAQMQPSTV